MAARTYPSYLIYLDTNGRYRWRCQAGNGRTIADSSEGYHNYADGNRMIAVVGAAASNVWKSQDVTNRGN